jgi:helix-turn-helix protein
MSIEALIWAKRTPFGSPSRKLVMMMLADYADEDWSCFPSQRTLAEVTELGERTVRRILGDLEADGWISRIESRRADGGRTSDRIWLQHPGAAPPTGIVPRPPRPPGHGGPPPPATMAGPPPAMVAGQEPPVDEPPVGTPVGHNREQLTLVGDTTAAPQPYSDSIVPGSDRDLFFAAFWLAYPRKAGKGAARTAWTKARRRGVAPEVLIEGARAYADDPNREDQYTAHPATWLNQERWLDGPLPDRRSGGRAPTAMAGTMARLRQVAGQEPRDDPARQLPTTRPTALPPGGPS